MPESTKNNKKARPQTRNLPTRKARSLDPTRRIGSFFLNPPIFHLATHPFGFLFTKNS